MKTPKRDVMGFKSRYSENDIINALNDLKYDEKSGCQYDLFAGGYLWNDELPELKQNNELYLACNLYIRKAIAYRNSLSIGEPRNEFKDHWDRLKSIAPKWPGFNECRIYGEIERKAKIAAKKCMRDINETVV